MKAWSPQFLIAELTFNLPIDFVFFFASWKLSQWMDISHRGYQDDFCETVGFLCALRDVLRLQRGALMWAGHPCNPFLVGMTSFWTQVMVSDFTLGSITLRFVWMSSGTHWRHLSIFGDERPLVIYKYMDQSWWSSCSSQLLASIQHDGFDHFSVFWKWGQPLTAFGNKCSARFALLLILCMAIGVHWVATWLQEVASNRFMSVC